MGRWGWGAQSRAGEPPPENQKHGLWALSLCYLPTRRAAWALPRNCSEMQNHGTPGQSIRICSLVRSQTICIVKFEKQS